MKIMHIWSTEEKDLLIKLINEGKQVHEIHKIMPQRTINSIHSKMWQLNLYSKSGYNVRWTKDEVKKLIHLNETGKSNQEIAKELDKTTECISNKLCRLNNKSNPAWNKNDDIRLLEAVKIEKDIQKIANQLKRTYSAVTHRMNRLGLSTKRGQDRQISIDFINGCNNKKLGKILNNRFINIRQSSKSRKIKFSITREDLLDAYDKQGGLCFYTKMVMELKSQNLKNYFVISVDRIDSNKGYEKDNIVLCCYIVNVMKQDLSVKDFLIICNKITSNFSSIEYISNQYRTENLQNLATSS